MTGGAGQGTLAGPWGRGGEGREGKGRGGKGQERGGGGEE